MFCRSESLNFQIKLRLYLNISENWHRCQKEESVSLISNTSVKSYTQDVIWLKNY